MQIDLFPQPKPVQVVVVVVDWRLEHSPGCLRRREDFVLDDFQSLDSPGRCPTGGARTAYVKGFGYVDHGYHWEL